MLNVFHSLSPHVVRPSFSRRSTQSKRQDLELLQLVVALGRIFTLVLRQFGFWCVLRLKDFSSNYHLKSITGLSASERKHIQRQTFYCTVGGRTLSCVFASLCIRSANLIACLPNRLINLIPAAMSAIVTILIVFTLAVLLCLIRRRSSPLGTARRVDMEFAMRCIPFGAYLLASASIAIVYIDDFAAPTPDLFVCTIPIAAVLVFGTQRDVLRFWGSVFGRTIFATTHSPGNVPLPMSLATNKSPRKPKGNGHHLETSFGNLDPALSVDYAVHEICDTFHIQHTGHNVTAFDMEDGKFEGLSGGSLAIYQQDCDKILCDRSRYSKRTRKYQRQLRGLDQDRGFGRTRAEWALFDLSSRQIPWITIEIKQCCRSLRFVSSRSDEARKIVKE